MLRLQRRRRSAVQAGICVRRRSSRAAQAARRRRPPSRSRPSSIPLWSKERRPRRNTPLRRRIPRQQQPHTPRTRRRFDSNADNKRWQSGNRRRHRIRCHHPRLDPRRAYDARHTQDRARTKRSDNAPGSHRSAPFRRRSSPASSRAPARPAPAHLEKWWEPRAHVHWERPRLTSLAPRRPRKLLHSSSAAEPRPRSAQSPVASARHKLQQEVRMSQRELLPYPWERRSNQPVLASSDAAAARPPEHDKES